jgi:hypothetical protein
MLPKLVRDALLKFESEMELVMLVTLPHREELACTTAWYSLEFPHLLPRSVISITVVEVILAVCLVA